MIIIGRKPADADAIGREYPQGSFERFVVQKIASGIESYEYDSTEHLKFELKLRKEIVNAASALNKSRLKFAVFRDSFCNKAYWSRTNEGGFVLKSGASPANAIKDIYAKGWGYGTECATAMIIVYYGALLNVYGEKLFNALFPKIHLMNWHYIDRLLKETGQMRKIKDELPGDRRYFANPDVDPLTPEWQGENVIDLNGKLYYGHGIGIHDAASIIRELNKNRRDGADESAYLLDKAGRPDFKKLYEASLRSL